MKLVLFVGLSLLISACGNRGQSSDAKNRENVDAFEDYSSLDLITCWGVGAIEFDDNLKSLEDKVGEDNITTDSLFLEGMFQGLITTLWKGESKEVSIHWMENKPPYSAIKYLEISKPGSVYAFANGIKVGSTLAEIEQLNGSAFNLYGFGWDYGGTFIDFGNGKLANNLPCFGGVFQLNAEAAPSISGDQPLKSNAPAFSGVDITLKTIRIKNADIN